MQHLSDGAAFILANRLETLSEFADPPVRLAQRRDVLFPLGDVLDLRNEIEWTTRCVAHQRDRQEDPDNVAILVKVPFLHVVVRE